MKLPDLPGARSAGAAAGHGAPCRVMVTGLGLVSAAGIDVEAARQALLAGRSAIGPIRSFNASVFGGGVAGEARSFTDDGSGEDRALQMLRRAADEALGARGAGRRGPDPRLGVVVGTSQGAILTGRPLHRRCADARVKADGVGAPESDAAGRLAAYRPGHVASRLADFVAAGGPAVCLGMACVSSAVAIAHGAELIRRGLCDRVVAGGVDSFNEFVFAGFHVLGALADRSLRPFDQDRSGTVLGEAAALVLLESAGAAAARGAPPLAEIAGAGCAADAAHPTAPDRTARGLILAIRQAMAEAGCSAGEVDYVCAHGTGTEYNDAMECRAFAEIFGQHPPPVSAVKSIFGHTLGAAGALDTVCTILGMRDGFLPPTVHLERPIAGPPWDFVPRRARRQEIRTALNVNSAFGGTNTALILRAPPPPARRPTRLDAGAAAPGPSPVAPAAAGDLWTPDEAPWIVGLGAVSPFGLGTEVLAARLAGRRRDLATVDLGARQVKAGQVGKVPIGRYESPRARHFVLLDRLSRLAYAAAGQALEAAGIAPDDPEARRTGVSLGTCYGCHRANFEFDRRPIASPRILKGLSAKTFAATVHNAPAGWIALGFGLQGPNTTFCSGRAAGFEALGQGLRDLLSGRAERVLCGGVEHLPLVHFALAEASAPRSEGAAMVLLETPEAARRRGVTAAARVLGIVRGRQRPSSLLHAALARRGLAPQAVGIVEQHGAGRDWSREDRAALPSARWYRDARYLGETLGAWCGFGLIAALRRRGDPGSHPPLSVVHGRNDDGEHHLLLLAVPGFGGNRS